MGTLRATATALGYLIRGRLWTARRREPTWAAIEEAWRSQASGNATASRDTSLAADDRIRVLGTGEEGFSVRAALYASAAAAIDLATYYIQADETGRSTVQALAACAARGVRVRLLVDARMMVQKEREVPGTLGLLAQADAAGIAVRRWRDRRRPYDAQHRKILLIDGRTAIVGGRNIADHYRGDEWRDADVLIEGPSAAALTPLFEAAWSGTPPPSEAGHWRDHVPGRAAADAIAVAALTTIEHARDSIDIELAYLVLPHAVCEALARAAARGVRVRVLTNSAASTDLWFTVWGAHACMRRLAAAGCQVQARQGRGRTLHTKLVIVDREWVTVGSHNLDYYSTRYCCETNLVARDARLAAALHPFFEAGLADAEPISDEAARDVCRRSPVSRVFDRVFRDFQ
ncbi:MAG TPA: phosphatidylserine/phosphatidylglycerophosphate/cardiolipin synthase family protein [Vicinamibacterales bacterium]|jgi:cardiolipin synthase